MLSRVANSIYWMSRYLERADNVARFIDVNAWLMLDLSLSAHEAQWYPLVATSGDDADFNARFAASDEASVVRFLTFDRKNSNSILSCVHQARENARTVREIIPSEIWSLINELYHLTESHSRKRSLLDLQEFYRLIHATGHEYSGLLHNTMSRDEGFWFALLGQMIERAEKTVRILDVKYYLLLPSPDMVNSAFDTVQWGAMLKSVSALEMYRQAFHSIRREDVAQFVLFSQSFPRSLSYCVQSVGRALVAINRLDAPVPASHAMEEVLMCLDFPNATPILNSGLHEYIDLVQLKLNGLDTAINKSFFQ